jgi:peptidoglycan hydrolase-like protein with peptidoglycan-binding domain
MPVTTDTSRPVQSLSTRALESAVESGRAPRRGSSGDAVSEAQRLLEAHGFSVGAHGVDGRLGRDTSAAVVRFQRSRGLEPDGIIGRDTLRELRTPTAGVDNRRGVDRGVTPGERDRVPGMSGEEVRRRAQLEEARRRQQPTTTQPSGSTETSGNTPVTLAPRGASEREKFEHYAAIVRSRGGQVCADGKPTVLGIRGTDINGNRHETTSARRYDDVFVVLTPDGRAQEFKGSTHAGQVTSSLVSHVGRINEGNYQVAQSGVGSHRGQRSFHVTTLSGNGNIPAVRDLNDDGRFSASERATAQQRRTTQDGILFHVGDEGSPHSIGCQTIPPSQYQRFLNAVGRRGFSYTLVQS